MVKKNIEDKTDYQKIVIERFMNIIDNIRDDKIDMPIVIEFLSELLRIKKIIPPTIEMITVLKKHKPNLFYHIKQHVSKNSNIYLLLNLDIDYDLAVERLGIKNNINKTFL